HVALYRGPFKAVLDAEGHLFPKGEAVEVCIDTAERLKQPPYSDRFIVIDPPGNIAKDLVCGSDKDKKCCG
ncbi:MAG: hypothetical protein QMD05_10320, partial [Candidatus Brocadiaceae bacterium]|nr:hypothetical protein [Candidatus Brocadiaceae bacterium]